ncbi:M23 family metallopeptidase [Streptomyces sp. SP18BB07]|uniref:M23 family metallopeptidase n=1 Tax=Streptomyces sp. SP18BB07 TaxID=3002522 RepID=UPI002E7A684E|nr:M23 family metallopeptidase [Streptomyces sp. SP18BB07]MEE1761526.1 M23 family metallopeptidase [Streptomyces sp. SP18BB07]
MSDEMPHGATPPRRSGAWPALLVCLMSALLLTAWTTAPRAAPGQDAAPAPPAAEGPVPAVARVWPVGLRPLVARAWEPPPTPYARGHRGVDLAAPPGSPVRAVAPGRVAFAGRVAGRGVVSIELTGTGDPPLRTTYEPVRTSAKKGDEVTAGTPMGTLEAAPSHCPTACLHWGLRRGDTYLDPLALLPPWLLRRGPSRLLPVPG